MCIKHEMHENHISFGKRKCKGMRDMLRKAVEDRSSVETAERHFAKNIDTFFNIIITKFN